MKVLISLCLIWIIVPIIDCRFFDSDYSVKAFRQHKLFTDTTSEQLTKDLIIYHQVIRDYHNLGPLVHSSVLESYARHRAILISYWDQDAYPISDSLHVGENVWFQPNETLTNATTVIRGWYYQQLTNYNYSEPKITPRNQNFAQIVWKETTQLGCGQVYSSRSVSDPNKSGTYTVCHYFKAGLTPSQESINIPPPQSITPLTVNPRNLETIIEGMVKNLINDKSNQI